MEQVVLDAPPEEMGGVDVLNCGAGHLKFDFDSSQPKEVEHAKKVIQDMLKKGYMLFVNDGGEQKQVHSFDPNKEVYYLKFEFEETLKETPEKKKRGRPRKAVSMKGRRATGVGPTAGG